MSVLHKQKEDQQEGKHPDALVDTGLDPIVGKKVDLWTLWLESDKKLASSF